MLVLWNDIHYMTGIKNITCDNPQPIKSSFINIFFVKCAYFTPNYSSNSWFHYLIICEWQISIIFEV